MNYLVSLNMPRLKTAEYGDKYYKKCKNLQKDMKAEMSEQSGHRPANLNPRSPVLFSYYAYHYRHLRRFV